MSYLISAVVIPVENDQYRYGFIGGFDGLMWHMNKDKPKTIKKLNKSCLKQIPKKPDNYTTLEKLSTAPMDEVIIIKDENTWESMKDRKPVSNREGKINLSEYLKP